MAAPDAGSPAWLTQDAEVNTWLSENVDTNCLMCLANLPEPDRRSKGWSTMAKHRAGRLQGNPSAYIMGILRREQEGPYGRLPPWQQGAQQAAAPPGWQPAGPRMEGPPLDLARLRSVPTPQPVAAAAAQPLAKAVPDWARAAWSIKHRPAALLRALSKIIPKEIAQVSLLPDQVQMACCIALLVSPEGHANPERFVNLFISWFRRMPEVAKISVSASESSAQSDSLKLVVVHLGVTSGYELHALNLALETYCRGGRKASISEVLCCDTSSSWSCVVEQFVSSMTTTHPAQHLSLGDAQTVLLQKIPKWVSDGVRILCLITLPKPAQPTTHAGVPAPSYHASTGRDLWTVLACVSVIAASVPTVATVALQPPQPVTPADKTFLDEVFGAPVDMDTSSSRVPQAPWVLRAAPLHQNEHHCLRKVGLPGAAAAPYAQLLRGAFDMAVSPPAQLPTILEAEEALDQKYANETLTEQQLRDLDLVRVRGPGGQPGSLLSRAELADLFGASNLLIQEHFEQKLPCAGFVSSFTGQPLAQADGGERCGSVRWCPACSYFYEHIVETPSLWTWARAILPTLRTIGEPALAGSGAFRGPIDSSKLTLHTCSSACSSDF